MSFLCNRWLRVLLDWKSLLGLLKAKFLVLNFSHCIHELPDDVICNIAIYADDTTHYAKCDQVSDLWQQLELASEFESDLRDILGQEVLR